MNIDQVKKLYYTNGLSAKEVGNRLGKTVWQIIKFMKKHGLKRRLISETQRLQFNRKPLSYNRRRNLAWNETELHIAGVMLYWAEGSKLGKYVVDFANSDKEMAIIFLSMLRKIYSVDEKKLRIFLYCYANQKPDYLIQYWSKLLNVPKTQFSKPYIRLDFDRRKITRMRFGLVHIRYADMRLLKEIKQDIAILSKKLRWDGGVDKHTSL